ncbi:MAG TPA: hypothetical protein PKI03_18275 [Pseudomonadota bacterium]|nr:hypothetical protein [Pseudomonadota bacterium]
MSQQRRDLPVQRGIALAEPREHGRPLGRGTIEDRKENLLGALVQLGELGFAV